MAQIFGRPLAFVLNPLIDGGINDVDDRPITRRLYCVLGGGIIIVADIEPRSVMCQFIPATDVSFDIETRTENTGHFSGVDKYWEWIYSCANKMLLLQTAIRDTDIVEAGTATQWIIFHVMVTNETTTKKMDVP